MEQSIGRLEFDPATVDYHFDFTFELQFTFYEYLLLLGYLVITLPFTRFKKVGYKRSQQGN